jgi:hypothetical protein
MKIEWTEPAIEDLRNLHGYIARDSEIYMAAAISVPLNHHLGKWTSHH